MYCIAYPPGAYGNFIAWTLEWLQGKYPVDYRPFNNNQKNKIYFNNHAWNSVYAHSVNEACALAHSGVLLHLSKKDMTLESQIKHLHSVYDKILYIYPEPNDFVWYMNNYDKKAIPQGWVKEFKDLLDENSHHWQGNQRWELREQLSFLLHEVCTAGSGIRELHKLDKKYIEIIPINQLRDNFEKTIIDIANWLDLEIFRTHKEIDTLYHDWLEREIFANKDKLISDLVDAIINNKHMSMKDLTIVDECEIQRQLRVLGYEIKCYGLNEWPETTTQLRELIYEAED